MRLSYVPTIALVAALFLGRPCPAADPVQVQPAPAPAGAKWAEVSAGVGRLVRLQADRPGRWVLVDDAGADLQASPDGKAAVFAAAAPGRYRLLVIAGDADPARVVVVVGGAGPPAPKPPDPSPPDPPADPLRAKLRTAYDADGGDPGKKELARGDLVELYRQAAKLAVEDETTTSEILIARVQAAGKRLLKDHGLPDGLIGTRKVVAAVLAEAFPFDESLTKARKAEAAALFTKLSDALGW